MHTYFLALTIPVTTVSLLYARWEYRKLGKLTILGTLLLCIMLVMPNLVLHYTINYDLPVSILDYIGLVISCVGLGICFISIVHFLSILKTLGLKVGKLSTAGSYQWSRNPQYLGWFIFLIGFALDDFSLWALAALIELAISLHLLVLIEEKHLLRSFGNQYTGFCKKVPRYIGLLKKDK